MKRFSAVIVMLALGATTTGAAARQGGNFGLGIIIGEPTGPCFKLWTGQKTAFDGAVAWSLANDARLHLHADYLIHNFTLIKVDKGQLPLYYGLGGRIRFAEGNADDHVGIRIPVGLDYLFEGAPVDLFLEIVPILDIAPNTDLDINGALGVRYFF